MKLNFRKFPVYTSIRKDMVVEQDISFLLSDGIYMHVPGVMAKAVALRIYSAEGEVELTQQETDALVEWVGMFSGIIADSVIDYIKKHQ